MRTMDDELLRQLDYLGIRGLKDRWSDYVAHAEKEGMGHDRFLRHVVAQSYAHRRAYAREMRLKRAAIEEVLVMETFPFEKQPNLDRKRVLNIHDSMDYVHKHQNVVLVGPPGCGKTGIATSFLVNAINHDHTGYFITFPKLISILFKSLAAHKEDRLLKTLAAFDVMCIDEIGYVEVEPAQTGLFFRLMSMRHRRKSTIVTSNLGFSEWAPFLKNDQLTAALIDRLTENSHVINMKKCVSIRPKGPDDDGGKPARASAAAAKKRPMDSAAGAGGHGRAATASTT